METLKKATYVTVISVSVILCSLFLLLAIPNLAFMWEIHDDRVDTDKAVREIRANAAYGAMYDRYPDAVERINHDHDQVEMEVGVMNGETGNQLILRIYAYSEHSLHVTVHCIDSVMDDQQYVDGLFAAEFVRTTDCVSAP